MIRDGLRLSVADAGGPGRPVLFQHGLCGDARQTSEVFPPAPRLRRITLECRGHGASEAGDPAGFAIATFAGDVAACIEGLGVGAVPVGGISMGAAIALRLAVTRPELVRALILARPAWLFADAPHSMRPNAEVGALLAAMPAEAARARFLAGDTARDLARTAPDNLASLEGFFARTPQPVTAALLQRIAADGPGVTEAQARALRLPTLVIGTARDAIHPLRYAETLAGVIPGARLCVIASKADDRAAYVVQFRAALAAFLEEVAA